MKYRRLLSYWLFFNALMVLAMAVIGAITRLTESGLSIAEWKPLAGTLPPLNLTEWERVFSLYRETPQYEQLFKGMSLAEFKGIFWWEWIHRFWGRLIGLTFALPLAVFWLKGWLTPWLKRRALLLLTLGAAQAFMGWFMVSSGLVDVPSVSHYRLAAHLSLALLIFSLLLWTSWQVAESEKRDASFCLRRHGWVGLALLATTIVWGAFVAGMDAGKIYNEWPLMGGHLLAAEALDYQPLWHNFTKNHAMVQFTHRWLAIFTALFLLAFAWRVRRLAPRPALGVAIMCFIQPLLGIITLLYAVPVSLGALHQAGGIVLLAFTLRTIYAMQRQGSCPR
jgi:cytochrome c oxidase assembly protein subunit 15